MAEGEFQSDLLPLLGTIISSLLFLLLYSRLVSLFLCKLLSCPHVFSLWPSLFWFTLSWCSEECFLLANDQFSLSEDQRLWSGVYPISTWWTSAAPGGKHNPSKVFPPTWPGPEYWLEADESAAIWGSEHRSELSQLQHQQNITTMAAVLSLVYSRVTKDRVLKQGVFTHTFQFDLNQNYKHENSPTDHRRTKEARFTVMIEPSGPTEFGKRNELHN